MMVSDRLASGLQSFRKFSELSLKIGLETVSVRLLDSAASLDRSQQQDALRSTKINSSRQSPRRKPGAKTAWMHDVY